MLRRIVVRALIALGVLALVFALVFAGLRSSGLPRREGTAHLAGLASPVEVRWTRWGVPCVTAAGEADLAEALGYLHANDRLVQMELGRRAAFGTLAELVGRAALERDRNARQLRGRRTAEALWKASSPDTRAWLAAYARGVNAWLRERGRDLPPELRMLGARVAPWTPVDSLGIAFLMADDVSGWRGREEVRFLLLARFGAERTRDLTGKPGLVVPPPLLPLLPQHRPGAGAPPAAKDAPGGSNVWAVAGARSATGSPLLANDPHLGMGLPPFWYEVRLSAPGFDVAGMTLPGLPVVLLGQNRNLAWGLTNAEVDDHDLFLEVLDGSGRQVKRGDRWVPLRVEEEEIRVRFGGTETVRLLATDRGPLLDAIPELGIPPRSLAWTFYPPGDPLAAFLRLARASTLEEARAGLAGHVGPAQFLAVAHRDGGLLLTLLGRVPRRRGGDGLLPAPGWLPEYGWDGLRPQAENPVVARPAGGLIVNANEELRPPGAAAVPGDFDTPHRALRIRQLVAAKGGWTPEETGRLQSDVISLYAREVVAALGGPYEGDAGRALAALKAWDGGMRVREGAPALFALAEAELLSGAFGDEQEAAGLPVAIAGREQLLRLLRGGMSPAWFDDVSTPRREERREVVAAALERAWRRAGELWGSDPAGWSYGRVHTLRLGHALGFVPLLGSWVNRGPFPVPGSETTIAAFAGAVGPDGEIPVGSGPSVRRVADTADPDRSLNVLPGGQSGHPADPHYDDQAGLFLEGRLRPVAWSPGAVARATVSVLRLLPGAPQTDGSKK